jgi:hypothetical protein
MRMQYKEELDGAGALLNLKEITRLGSRQMIASALVAEISTYVE